MRFEFSHTHAYPGCKVVVSEASQDANADACIVEFSDGVVVPNASPPDGETIVLHILPYRTARGTRINTKSWLLQPDGPDGRWRVQRRLPEGLKGAD